MTMDEFCIKHKIRAREMHTKANRWRLPHTEPFATEIEGKLFLGTRPNYRIMRFYAGSNTQKVWTTTQATMNIQALCLQGHLDQQALRQHLHLTNSQAIWLLRLSQIIDLKTMSWLSDSYDEFLAIQY
jgi:hypothetical protein